jgi:2-dehydro-3-deoxyphosphogluconate aldolase/(4S)-4-hydroxy-2-oxoglutarate aldolase
VVLRPREPIRAAPLLERLEGLGLVHVEIAWQSGAGWITQCRELIASFPGLRLGAASICSNEAISATREAGFRYAMAPILEASLLRQAEAVGLTLVPGVMTPTEIHQAMALGCRLVKLFPAAVLGPSYWAGLREPLGAAMPFCIAAGGLRPEDVLPWLRAGVDATALGSQRFAGADQQGVTGGDKDLHGSDGVDGATLRELLASLAR